MLKKNLNFKKLKGVATILALAGMVVFTGCKNTHKEGEGTNYPFTWTEKGNGQIVVKLDGSKSADYSWTAVSEDESIATVKAKKEEKDGVIKYTIYPQTEGITTIVFKRERDTGEVPFDGTAKETEGETSEVKPVEEEPVSETEEEGVDEDEDSVEILQNVFNRMVAEDRVCVIKLDISVVPKNKKGTKYKATCFEVRQDEQEGLQIVEGEAVNYRFWKEEDGALLIRFPKTNQGWLTSVTCKYTGTQEEAEIVDGIVPDEPEQDENGQKMTVNVYAFGNYENEDIFCVMGIAQGEAIVTFTSPEDGFKIEFVLSISDSGEIVVVDHAATTYKATQQEIDEQSYHERPEDESEVPSEEPSEAEDGKDGDDMKQEDGSKG